jgi:hypothetical protein
MKLTSHPLLPRTALAGAILLLLGGLLEVAQAVVIAWSHLPGSFNQLLLRPALSLVMAVLVPWAIVRMNGLFYWFVVVLYGLMLFTMLVAVAIGSISPFPELTMLDTVLVVIATLAGILLCSRQTMQAFYRHGRLGLP